MTSTVVFDTIKSLTNDTLTAFEKRETTLKELSINQVYPMIEDIANRLRSGPDYLPVTTGGTYLKSHQFLLPAMQQVGHHQLLNLVGSCERYAHALLPYLNLNG